MNDGQPLRIHRRRTSDKTERRKRDEVGRIAVEIGVVGSGHEGEPGIGDAEEHTGYDG